MIVVETFLICDGGCGNNYGVDNRGQPGKYHRIKARQEGWRVYNGKDFCPNCMKNKNPTTKKRSEYETD